MLLVKESKTEAIKEVLNQKEIGKRAAWYNTVGASVEVKLARCEGKNSSLLELKRKKDFYNNLNNKSVSELASWLHIARSNAQNIPSSIIKEV